MSLRSLRELWVEFCTGGTVYAMRYLVLAKLLLIERLWWLLCIGGSAAITLLTITSTYRKYHNNPLIISYASQFVPISSIPFPAVTVCPMAKTSVEELNLTEVFETVVLRKEPLSWDRLEKLNSLAHVCSELTDVFDFTEPLNDTSVETLMGMAPPSTEHFLHSYWCNSVLEPREVLTDSLTDKGLCFTFNAIAAEDLYRVENLHSDYQYSKATRSSQNWSMEGGYGQGESYPYRSFRRGLQGGLLLDLGSRRLDDEVFCEGLLDGFKVLIHAPDEVPMVNDFYYRLPMSAYVALVLVPELTVVAASLNSYPYTSRQCYFSGEKYLRYFKVYNQNNCLAECVANRTAEICGCVHLAMVRGPDTRICNAHEIACYRAVYADTYSSQARFDGQWQDACGCLPTCKTVRYDVEISQLPFNYEAYIWALGFDYSEADEYVTSSLTVTFKNNQMLPLIRRELIGFGDMLARFGGLYGLMMGASVVSLMEILYYVAIRPWRDFCYHRRVRRFHDVHEVLPWHP
ncbi:hypothetical protein pipiens_017257 [Culex pipiens pipiens]|uniref:Pickpocket n=1 Tax=Culex pipiens pipiens TaxID=38569 RepID=A0ABD1CHG7_CULPP